MNSHVFNMLTKYFNRGSGLIETYILITNVVEPLPTQKHKETVPIPRCAMVQVMNTCSPLCHECIL